MKAEYGKFIPHDPDKRWEANGCRYKVENNKLYCKQLDGRWLLSVFDIRQGRFIPNNPRPRKRRVTDRERMDFLEKSPQNIYHAKDWNVHGCKGKTIRAAIDSAIKARAKGGK